MKLKKIKIKQGAGSMLMGVVTMLLGLMFMVMIMEFSNISYSQAVAQTRADSMADATAVIAQSYDYNYNKTRAQSYLEEIADRNQEAGILNLESEIEFPENNILTVTTKVSIPTFYPDIIGISQVRAIATSTVKSVNIYGDTLVISQHSHDLRNRLS